MPVLTIVRNKMSDVNEKVTGSAVSEKQRRKTIKQLEKQYKATALAPEVINMLDAHNRLAIRQVELAVEIQDLCRQIYQETWHADTTKEILESNKNNFVAQRARVSDALFAITQTITEAEKRVTGLLEMVEPELSIYPFAKVGVSA